MPTGDVSDLRDVVDAINRLCDTMKTSYVAPRGDDHSSTDQTTDDVSGTELTEIRVSISSTVTECSEIYTHSSKTDTQSTYIDTISSIMQPIENSAFVLSTLTQPTTIISHDQDSSTSIFAKCIVKSSAVKNSAQSSNIQVTRNDIVSSTIIHQPQDSIVCSSAITQSERTVVTTQPTEVNAVTSSAVTPTEDCIVSSSVESALVPSNTSQQTEDNVLSSTQPAEVEVSTTLQDAEVYGNREIELVSPEEVSQKVFNAERWSDSMSQVSLPGQVDDAETVTSDPCENALENASEMYYTASSEVSLLSDLELQDKGQEDDRKECVVHGHVAAMRERFESMTRTNTPCPDMVRSLSPSLEAFRNVSPSPDRLA